jgi:hypothetical protein
MNISQFVAFYEAGKYVYQLWNEMQNDGKEYISETSIKNNNGHILKVKVCFNCARQRYLQIKLPWNAERKILAGVDNYQPGEYLAISRDEWHIFFLLTNFQHDSELYAYAQKIVNRLVDKANNNENQKRSLISSPTQLHQAKSQVA